MIVQYDAIVPCVGLVSKQRTWSRSTTNCEYASNISKQEIYDRKYGKFTQRELYSKSTRYPSNKRMLAALNGC